MNASPIEQRLDALKKALWETHARELYMQAVCVLAATGAWVLGFGSVQLAAYSYGHGHCDPA